MLNIISMVTTKKIAKDYTQGTLLAFQWLRCYASTAWETDSIPHWGIKIPVYGKVWQKKKECTQKEMRKEF